MITNNYFNGDPLLGNSPTYEERITAHRNALAELEQQKRTHEQELLRRQSQQPQISQTPVWDEINAITQAMSDKEFAIMAENEEFQESHNRIMAIQNDLFLQMMRPMVEGCQAGKDALEKHLTLVKRLRKSATEAVDRELDDFKEYREHYSHMSYDEYREMKLDHDMAENGTQGGRKKGGKK